MPLARVTPRRLKKSVCPNSRGIFVTFEGIEGSGKSTQLALLTAYLKEQNHEVIQTREPGGTAIGERIRSLILDKRNHQITAKSELLLYLASRVQHVMEVIAPALQEGKIVLSDRFSDATLAYQGTGRKLVMREIIRMDRFATGGIKPDRTFLLDIDVEQGLSRIKKRGALNRMDRERSSFYQAVRTGYLNLAEGEPERIRLIDAGQSIEKVASEVRKEMRAIIS